MSDVCDECLDAQVNSAPESFAVAEAKRLAIIAEGNAILRLTTTAQELPGYRVTQSFGIVRGNADAVKVLSVDPEQARVRAMERMSLQAHALGANAIIAMIYSTTYINRDYIEVLVYGTAVRAEPIVA